MKLRTASLDITVCQDFKSRLIGLLTSQPIGARQAVLLTKCSCIHTFGMREPLSLFFLNKDLDIVQTQIHAKPRRIYRFAPAQHVIEMARKTDQEFEQVRMEIALLRRDTNSVEYFNKGRIKARV